MNPLVRKLMDPLSRLFAPVYGGLGTIVYLDQIGPRRDGPRIASNVALEQTPEFLEAVLRHFQRRDYTAVPLGDLPGILRGERRLEQRFVCYTFDDGYASSLTHALPLFRRHGTPFTVNLTTSFIDGAGMVWWYDLEDLLLRHDEVEFDWQGETVRLSCPSHPEKEQTFDRLTASIRSLGVGDRDAFLRRLFEAHGADPHFHARTTCLDWDQANELAADPLVTIGAHTVNHHNFTRLTDTEIEHEVTESRRLIEARLNRPAEHFSYPFGGAGAVGRREADLVARMGFRTAVTTRQANVFRAHQRFPHLLPRITLSGNYPTLSRVERLRTGSISACRRPFKRVITLE